MFSWMRRKTSAESEREQNELAEFRPILAELEYELEHENNENNNNNAGQQEMISSTPSSLSSQRRSTFFSCSGGGGGNSSSEGDNSGVSSDISTDQNNNNGIVSKTAANVRLALLFLLLVIAGAANSVFAKLAAIPMYNYPNFLNLYGNILFVPICFAYIIPMQRFRPDVITAEQVALPKRPFAVMGALDCIATMMSIFASVYLPGPLLVLLPQATIPTSMILSRYILRTKYSLFQYAGAAIVLVGIVVVLEPLISKRHFAKFVCQAVDLDRDCMVCQEETTKVGCESHEVNMSSLWYQQDSSSLFEEAMRALGSGPDDDADDDNALNGDDDDSNNMCEWLRYSDSVTGDEGLILVWSFVMIISCIPRTLSTIFKELALSEETMKLDPIFLNGWIAVFQLMFSLMLAVPAGVAGSPPVQPLETFQNLWEGFQCFLGHGTINEGCHPDSMCKDNAALYVNISLLVNVVYVILMMYVIKHGSTNLLYLALTIMVPLGNLAFTLPFMPHRTPLHLADVLGLAVIMVGIVMFRFADSEKQGNDMEQNSDNGDDDDDESSDSEEDEDEDRRILGTSITTRPLITVVERRTEEGSTIRSMSQRSSTGLTEPLLSATTSVASV